MYSSERLTPSSTSLHFRRIRTHETEREVEGRGPESAAQKPVEGGGQEPKDYWKRRSYIDMQSTYQLRLSGDGRCAEYSGNLISGSDYYAIQCGNDPSGMAVKGE